MIQVQQRGFRDNDIENNNAPEKGPRAPKASRVIPRQQHQSGHGSDYQAIKRRQQAALAEQDEDFPDAGRQHS